MKSGEIFEDAHILEVNKIHEVSPNNNKGTNIPTLKSNATNVVTCLDKTIYKHVPQRIKFVLNAPNGVILLKCVAQEMLIIWEIVTTKKNRTKSNQKFTKPNSIQSRLPTLRQKTVGRSTT